MLLGYIILIFPRVILMSLAVYFPVYLVIRLKKGKKPYQRHLMIFGFIGTVISIIFITILISSQRVPTLSTLRRLNIVPFLWLKSASKEDFNSVVRQLLMNSILFFPLGILLPIVFEVLRKWWLVAGTTFMFTLSIETLQFFLGRSADIDDILMNLLGGLIGYLVFLQLHKIFKKYIWWNYATNNILK